MRGIRLGNITAFPLPVLPVTTLPVSSPPQAGVNSGVRGLSTLSAGTPMAQRVITLKSPKALGLVIPQSVFIRADEVIR